MQSLCWFGCFGTVQQCSCCCQLQSVGVVTKSAVFRKRNPACNCCAPTQLFQIDTSFSTAPQASPGRPGQTAAKRVSLVTTKRTQFHKHDLVISQPNFTSKSLVSIKSNNSTLPSFQIYTFLREDHLVEINQDIHSVYQLHHQVQRHRESCFSSEICIKSEIHPGCQVFLESGK